MTLSEEYRAETQIVTNRAYVKYKSKERQFKDILEYSGNIIYRNKLTWDNTQQSKFIEHILLGFPLGIICITYSDSEMYVVDGTQRLMSIFNYYRNKLILQNLSILDLLNNTTFNNLVYYRKKKFLRGFITQIQLDDDINSDLRNNLYKL